MSNTNASELALTMTSAAGTPVLSAVTNTGNVGIGSASPSDRR